MKASVNVWNIEIQAQFHLGGIDASAINISQLLQPWLLKLLKNIFSELDSKKRRQEND